MGTQKYFDIDRHPLLVPSKIDGVLTYWLQNPNTYELASIMPLVTVNADMVEMDYALPRAGGMTPMVATGTGTPIYGGFSRGSRKFESAEWREKVLLEEPDLVKLRKIGTKDQLETGQNLLNRKYAVIQERLQNRLEWMRRQMLFDGTVTGETESGASIAVDYAHPAYLDPTLTLTDRWSDYANSNPLQDLQTFVEDFIDDTGFGVKSIHFPKFMWKHLQNNDTFMQAIFYNRPAANLSIEQVANQLVAFVGLGSAQKIIQSTSSMQVHTQLTAASAQSDTTLDLGDVSNLSAGDTIKVRRVTDLHAEKFTVASISGKTVTVTGSGVANATGFAAGDVVTYSIPIIPLNRILIVGQFQSQIGSVGMEGQPSPEFINTFADVCSTLSGYVDLNNRRPGPFTKLIDKMGEDPPRIEQVTGIRALPRLHYPDGWSAPTVL